MGVANSQGHAARASLKRKAKEEAETSTAGDIVIAKFSLHSYGEGAYLGSAGGTYVRERDDRGDFINERIRRLATEDSG